MPALSTQSPDLVRWSLLIVGGLYATFLAVKYGVKVLLRRAGRRYANTETLSELWDVAVSSWSVIYILWHAVHLLERVFRSIALSILGPGSMATNIVFAGTGFGTSGILLFDVSFVIFCVCDAWFPYTGHLVFRSETHRVSLDRRQKCARCIPASCRVKAE